MPWVGCPLAGCPSLRLLGRTGRCSRGRAIHAGVERSVVLIPDSIARAMKSLSTGLAGRGHALNHIVDEKVGVVDDRTGGGRRRAIGVQLRNHRRCNESAIVWRSQRVMRRHANIRLAPGHDRRPNTVRGCVRRDPDRIVCPRRGCGGGLQRRSCGRVPSRRSTKQEHAMLAIRGTHATAACQRLIAPLVGAKIADGARPPRWVGTRPITREMHWALDRQGKAAALVFRGITFRRRAPSPGGLRRPEPPLALFLAISRRALPPLNVVCRRGGHRHRSRRGLHHRRPFGRLGNRNTRPLSRQTGSGNPRIFAGAEHTPAPATTAPRLVGRIHT